MARTKRGTDEHFTGKTLEEPELKAGLSGLVDKRKFNGEEEKERKAQEEVCMRGADVCW